MQGNTEIEFKNGSSYSSWEYINKTSQKLGNLVKAIQKREDYHKYALVLFESKEGK
jgi:hypothetical protein